MIPFEIPSKYKLLLESGNIIRYGSLLKDVSTGQIVGHLKEAGQLSNIMSSLPISLNPLSSILNIHQSLKLEEISENLELLKMISSVGAISSLATLGVSVAGFIVVTKRLNKIQDNLDVALEKIERVQQIVEELQLKQDMLEFAEVKTASEQLHCALKTETKERKKDLLTQSNKIFHKYRNYYLKLAQNLWLDGKLPIEVANELYSRYITCVMGQLYSEFLLGDLNCFIATWELINKEVKSVSKFDKIAVLRAKSDNDIDRFLGVNYEAIKPQIHFTHDMLIETQDRINSMGYEAEYLQKNNIEPFEYLKKLGELDDGIILIPNQDYSIKI